MSFEVNQRVRIVHDVNSERGVSRYNGEEGRVYRTGIVLEGETTTYGILLDSDPDHGLSFYENELTATSPAAPVVVLAEMPAEAVAEA